MPLALQQGEELVAMARGTLESFTASGRVDVPRAWDKAHLKEKRGVFVTLKRLDGSLRGCIGFPYPVKPLGTAVVEATVSAAANDPRFSKVSEAELPGILVEVSVLTAPEVVRAASHLELPRSISVGVDGLIVSADGFSGLLLPQVATEFNLGPEDFLSETCVKAGLTPDAWLLDRVTVQKFQAEAFSEVSPRGTVKKL